MPFLALVYNRARSLSSQATAENTLEAEHHNIIQDTEKATGKHSGSLIRIKKYFSQNSN